MLLRSSKIEADLCCVSQEELQIYEKKTLLLLLLPLRLARCSGKISSWLLFFGVASVSFSPPDDRPSMSNERSSHDGESSESMSARTIASQPDILFRQWLVDWCCLGAWREGRYETYLSAFVDGVNESLETSTVKIRRLILKILNLTVSVFANTTTDEFKNVESNRPLGFS